MGQLETSVSIDLLEIQVSTDQQEMVDSISLPLEDLTDLPVIVEL